MRTLPGFLLLLPAAALAAGSPENVLVLVNGDSWASLAIANEYAAARDIASEHFVVLHDLPSFERVSVEDFREKILRPALQAAEKRGIAAQVDYVLYSADFPTAIDVSADMAGKKFPQQITQPAAITGLTFYYQLSLAKNPAYLGLNANFYFRQTAPSGPTEPLPEDDQRKFTEAVKAFEAIGARREAALAAKETAPAPAEEEQSLRTIRDTFLALKTAHPARTDILYQLAGVQARLGEGDAAVATLREALDLGWWDMRRAMQDADFRAVRDRPDFKGLADRARDAKFELWPTSGFRATVGWQPTGQPVPPNQGMRYLLSTMLAYTSGRGTSVSEAIASLQRSAKADGTRPAGTIYFLENDDIRSKTREWATKRAVEKLASVGVQAKIERGTLPQNRDDIAGLMMGTADFSWPASGSTILPGAIAEHLTSCGGMLREGDSQTPITEFLRHGAAGTSGTVNEPYAIQAKFPTPFVHYYYAQGCSLAESFYQSVAGPYQLLIMGDALCAPWKKRFTVAAPPLGENIRGMLKVEPATSSADDLKPSHFELHLDGRRVAVAKAGDPLQFDSTSAADGPHELQVLAHATDAIGTSARLVMPVIIRNGTVEITAESDARPEHPWSDPIRLKASAPNAQAIAFRHLGREVARIEAAQGDLELDPRTFGQGPVQLQPVALLEGGKELFGKPLLFRVVPPKPLPALEAPAGKTLAPSVQVIAAEAAPVAVEKAEGDWLTQAGVKPGTDFAVEGWFTVDADDFYQFQLRGPENLRLSVDGVPQSAPRGKAWWFVPVPLAKGLHRVRIEGKAEGKPQLDVRFGGPGTQRLSAPRFQHVP